VTQTSRYGGIIVFMSESWTDARLNDLRDNVVEFRAETHQEFVALRTEMKEEFAALRQEMKDEFAALRQEMRDGFAAVDDRFAAIDDKFDSVHDEFTALRREIKEGFEGMQRLMIQFMGVMIAALIGLAAATQL